MEEDLKRKFVIDTSALISLGSVGLFSLVLEYFDLIATPLVIREVEQFLGYGDELGRVAKGLLEDKDKIAVMDAKVERRLEFLEEADNELYYLSLREGLPLVTVMIIG